MTAFENVMLGVDQVFFTAAAEPSAGRSPSTTSTLVGLGDAMHRSPPSSPAACGSASASPGRSRCRPKMLLLDEPFGMLDSLTRFELQEVLIDLWAQGPEDRADGHARRRRSAVPLRPRRDDDQRPRRRASATMLEVTFPRPRDREQVMEHPDYYQLRERLIGFLEGSHVVKKRRTSRAAPSRRRPARNLDLRYASPVLA